MILHDKVLKETSQILIISVGFCVLFFSSCYSSTIQPISHSAELTNSTPTIPQPTPMPEIWKEIRLSKSSSRWHVVSKKLGNYELTHLFFLDSSDGWVIGQKGTPQELKGGVLYKSEDGGHSWKGIKPKIAENAAFSGIFFISKKKGWLASQKWNYENRNLRSLEMMTSSDGGNTWKTLRTFPDIVATSMTFNISGEGWVSGYRLTSQDTSVGVGVILHTTDEGISWEDVSPKQNESRWNYISSDAEGKLVAMSDEGKIVGTRDHGKSWQTIKELGIEHFKDLQAGTGVFKKFAVNGEQSLFALSGLNSQEGVVTNFQILNGQIQPIFRLSSVSITDFESADKGWTFFCGSRVQLDSKENRINRKGVVMVAGNFESWNIVHETPADCRQGCSFNSLAVVNNSLIAVGSKGRLVIISER